MSGLEPFLLAAGTGMQVIGAIQQGNAARAAGEYNAQTAQMEGAAREAAQRQQASRQMGAIRAGISKSGVRIEGTPLMVLAESAANAEIDALNTRYFSEREATLSRMKGKAEQRAAFFRAGTSLLAGAGRMA